MCITIICHGSFSSSKQSYCNSSLVQSPQGLSILKVMPFLSKFAVIGQDVALIAHRSDPNGKWVTASLASDGKCEPAVSTFESEGLVGVNFGHVASCNFQNQHLLNLQCLIFDVLSAC